MDKNIANHIIEYSCPKEIYQVFSQIHYIGYGQNEEFITKELDYYRNKTDAMCFILKRIKDIDFNDPTILRPYLQRLDKGRKITGTSDTIVGPREMHYFIKTYQLN